MVVSPAGRHLPAHGDRAMKFWKSLLEDHHPNVHDLATYLARPENELPGTTSTSAPVDIAAMFGVDDEEWRLAIRALHVERELSRIGHSFPRFYITKEVLEEGSSDTRLCLTATSLLREGYLENWLGAHVSDVDQLHLAHALRLLPDGWSIVIDSRQTF